MAKLAGIDVRVLERFVHDTLGVFEEVKAVHDPTGEAGLTVKNVKNLPNIMVNGGDYGTWIRNTKDGEECTRLGFGLISFKKKRGIPILTGMCPLVAQLQDELREIRMEIIDANRDSWSSFLKAKNPRKLGVSDRDYKRQIENKIVNIFNEYHEGKRMDEMQEFLVGAGLCSLEGLVNEWDGFKFTPLRDFTEEDLARLNEVLGRNGCLVALKTFGKARQDVIARAREFKAEADAQPKHQAGGGGASLSGESVCDDSDEAEVEEDAEAGGGTEVEEGCTLPAPIEVMKTPAKGGKRKAGELVEPPPPKKAVKPKAEKARPPPYQPRAEELKRWGARLPEERTRIVYEIDLLSDSPLDTSSVARSMEVICQKRMVQLGKNSKSWCVLSDELKLHRVEGDASAMVRRFVTQDLRMMLSKSSNERVQDYASFPWSATQINDIVTEFSALVTYPDHMKQMNKSVGLFPTAGGTLYDFATGTVRPRTGEDNFTFESAVKYIEDDEWTEEADMEMRDYLTPFCMIMDEDGELVFDPEKHQMVVDWLKHIFAGKSMKVVLVLLGKIGNNGKSALFECVLKTILSEFQKPLNPSVYLLTPGQKSNITTDLVCLGNSRLVVGKELKDADKFDVAKLNSVTGGDAITNRIMYGGEETLISTAGIAIHSNKMATFDTQDSQAFLARLAIWEFFVTFPPDEKFKERLRSNEFCSKFFTYVCRHGDCEQTFVPCASSRHAQAKVVAIMRSAVESSVEDFVETQCTRVKFDPRNRTGTSTLVVDFVSALTLFRKKQLGMNVKALTKSALTKRITPLGITQGHSGAVYWYEGLVMEPPSCEEECGASAGCGVGVRSR